MKKPPHLISIALLIFLLNGCGRVKPAEEAIAVINGHCLYSRDLTAEAELYPPSYRKSLTKEQILEDLIQKKILLLEAKRQQLDKDPNFMKMVERFWEQSLLKSLLEKKSEEILSSLKQTPEDERSQNASHLMQEWFDGLKKDAKIQIDRGALERIEIK